MLALLVAAGMAPRAAQPRSNAAQSEYGLVACFNKPYAVAYGCVPKQRISV
jgi:hypothetical protein